MIIVIEGVDKCGKSTLANKLVKEHGFRIIKFSAPKKNQDPYLMFMEGIKKVKPGERVVLDRYFHSGLVYGPIYRGKSDLSEEQIRNLELKLLSLNTFVIYCRDNASDIAARFKTDGETFAKEEHIEQMLRSYEQIMSESRLPVEIHQMNSIYDLTKGRVLDGIVSHRVKSDPLPFSGMIGNRVNPRLVLVGEKRNTNQKTKYSHVGQPFDFGPSSVKLFQVLKKLNIDLTKVAIINSDSKDLRVLKAWINGANIVALGDVASKVLHGHLIPHLKAPHPSFVKRFGKGEPTLENVIKVAYES